MFALGGQGSDKGSEGAKHGKQNHHDPLIRPWFPGEGVALGGGALKFPMEKGKFACLIFLRLSKPLRLRQPVPLEKKFRRHTLCNVMNPHGRKSKKTPPKAHAS